MDNHVIHIVHIPLSAPDVIHLSRLPNVLLNYALASGGRNKQILSVGLFSNDLLYKCLPEAPPWLTPKGEILRFEASRSSENASARQKFVKILL